MEGTNICPPLIAPTARCCRSFGVLGHIYTMILRTLAAFILVSLLTGGALAQPGWHAVQTPFAYADFDLASDSTITIFSGNCTALTTNAKRTWTQFCTAPVINAFAPPNGIRYNSIKVLSDHDLTLFGTSGRDALHGIYDGLLIHSSDTGRTWGNESSASSYTLRFVLPDHNLGQWYYAYWEVNEAGGFNRFIDGLTGKMVWQPTNGRNASSIELKDSVGMCTGLPGKNYIYVTRNGGANWTLLPNALPQPAGGNPRIHLGLNNIWYASDFNVLLSSKDTGAHWDTSAVFLGDISDFKFYDSTGYLVVSGQDYIERSDNGGKSWFAQSCVTSGAPVQLVAPTGRRTAYAWAIGTSEFMRLDDGGPAAGPVLSMRRKLSMGVLPTDIVDSQQVLIRNVGSGNLVITGYTSDHPNATISPAQFSVAAGDSIRISVKYRTHNGAGDTVRFSLVTNSSPADQQFTLTAAASLPVLVYSTDTLDFGATLISETQIKKLTVRNIGSATAIFYLATTASNVFQPHSMDTLPPGRSMLISTGYAPRSIGESNGRLIIRSNALASDTIWLQGDGVSSRSGTLKEGWVRSYSNDSTRSGVATNVTIDESGNALVVGSLSQDSGSKQVAIVRYSDAGSQLDEHVLVTDRAIATDLIHLAHHYGHEYAISYLAPAGEQADAHLLGLDTALNVRWRDTIAHTFRGVWPGYNFGGLPVLLSLNARGDCAFECSGFGAFFSNFNDGGTEEQIILHVLDSVGVKKFEEHIIGPSRSNVYASGSYWIGADFANDLVPTNGGFVTAMTIDTGSGWLSTRELPRNKFSTGIQVFDGGGVRLDERYHDRVGEGRLAYYNGVLVEASGSLTRPFKLQAFDDSLNLLWQTSLARADALDSVYSVTIDSSDGSIHVLGTSHSEVAGEDVEVLRFSVAGLPIWSRTFDGLGSGDDIPIKLIADHAGDVILVRSKDTSGDDFVVLKYNSTGDLVSRLRFDDPGHSEDSPKDITLGPKGSLYVVGSTSDSSQINRFTTIKFTDTTAASISPSTTPPQLSARLSQNPWQNATSLVIDKSQNESVHIQVFDVLGRTVMERSTASNLVSLNNSAMSDGLYSIVITNERGARVILKSIKD
jgi:hypothetical protein